MTKVAPLPVNQTLVIPFNASDGQDLSHGEMSNEGTNGRELIPVSNINDNHNGKIPGSGCDSNASIQGKDGAAKKEDKVWLDWITKEFIRIAGEDKVIDRDEFKTALQVKHSFFADRFFDLFDADNSGTIDLDELLDGLKLATNGTKEEQLKFLFDVFDVDGSGAIDEDEMKEVLRSCMEESSLTLGDENLEKLTQALFESADQDGSGDITYEELVDELTKHEGVLENLSMGAAQWLKPPPAKAKKKSKLQQYFSKTYFRNNTSHIVFLLVYMVINIACFVASGVYYHTIGSNVWVVIARGAGMCLNFNGAFVLVLMLRHSLTWLRTSSFGSRFLPIDNSIEYHKMVGIMICVFTFIHTIAHLVNIYVMIENDTLSFNGTVAYWEYLFTMRAGLGYVGPGFAYISGVVLDVILLVMVICSTPAIRRNGYFQVFYWTHMLYWVFWIFLILHSQRFGYFFALPGLIFIIEKISDLEVVKKIRYGEFFITQANLFPSRVTHLIISIPERFYYQPGDYVFIRIPAIAKHEWHPFTISSAPEMSGHIWLHIRAVGHWTNMLYDYFEQLEGADEDAIAGSMEPAKKSRSASSRRQSMWAATRAPLNAKKGSTKYVNIRVNIDGPYGTPTRDIFQTEHAVLIGSGIGVTPYASILQSMMYKYKASKVICPHCAGSWYDEIDESVMRAKKVDFIWINRSQKAFEWFVSLLTKLEAQESNADKFDKFFDMQMFMTAALKKSDMKGLGLQMAMDIIHKKENKDLITGLRTRTQPGRPDWTKVFKEIDENKKGEITVYFCGPPAVADILKIYCDKYGFKLSKESF